MKIQIFGLAASVFFTFGACTARPAETAKIQQNKTTMNAIFGKWQAVEKTAVTTPFGTVWTLNSADFGTDGRTLTAEFTREDGSPMIEHLSYEFVANYRSGGKAAVLMRNDFLKDLVVIFTVERLTASELALKAQTAEKAGALDFGTGTLRFIKTQ